MSPDERSRRRRNPPRGSSLPPQARTRPSPTDPHDVVYFQRHSDDDPGQRRPGREALRSFPPGVRAKMAAVLTAVAAAPPHRFSGGGYWEAMHGEMTGYYEVRADGPGRHHYRLFCLLDYDAVHPDHSKPLLVVLTGMNKPYRTTFTKADYNAVRLLGEEYKRHNDPRSLA
jgi:hypothetical protein